MSLACVGIVRTGDPGVPVRPARDPTNLDKNCCL
jgi:hypothetical protein